MSLDVHLIVEEIIVPSQDKAIFIREDGETKQISRREWDDRFPNQVPATVCLQESSEVYSGNITHNLWKMADAAGIYQHLWRPEELSITHAHQLIDPLEQGLDLLKSDCSRFAVYNPSNGWGSYEGLVSFVERYLAACKKYPQAEIRVSR